MNQISVNAVGFDFQIGTLNPISLSIQPALQFVDTDFASFSVRYIYIISASETENGQGLIRSHRQWYRLFDVVLLEKSLHSLHFSIAPSNLYRLLGLLLTFTPTAVKETKGWSS